MENAPNTAPSTPPSAPRQDLAARAASLITRLVTGGAGVALLVGFFLPWVTLGDVAAVSGFALLASSGTMIETMAGPSRGLLFVIPAAGLLMIGCSAMGPKAAARSALVSGLGILAFGLYTAARAFISSTGTGMWIVVLASLVAAGVGLVAAGRDSRPETRRPSG
jgi:hypothetical protein